MRTRMRAAAVLALTLTLTLTLAIVGGDAVRAEGPRDEPIREARRQKLFDQLDEARIHRDLLVMEVEADKILLQKMMTVLRETELQQIQGFSHGPVLSGNNPTDRDSLLERYKDRLAEVRQIFILESKNLSREQRRVAELEDQLGITTVAVAPAPSPRGERSMKDAEQVLDLILRGVESWQRATRPEERPAPGGRPAPEDRALKDADRVLDLIRKGIENWQRDPSPAPEERPAPRPAPAPTPTPEGRSFKDAERVLELILKGVESWQGR